MKMHSEVSHSKFANLFLSTQTHQSSTAEQDHKDDEALKPAVLHYPETGLS